MAAAPHKSDEIRQTITQASAMVALLLGLIAMVGYARQCDVSNLPSEVAALRQSDEAHRMAALTQQSINETTNGRLGAMREVLNDVNKSVGEVNKSLGDEKVSRAETNANVKNLTGLLELLRQELRELRQELSGQRKQQP